MNSKLSPPLALLLYLELPVVTVCGLWVFPQRCVFAVTGERMKIQRNWGLGHDDTGADVKGRTQVSAAFTHHACVQDAVAWLVCPSSCVELRVSYQSWFCEVV